MKKDHLPAELRRKVNYLRQYGTFVYNDHPGGYINFTVPYIASDHSGCGRGFFLHDIDQAIKYAEEHNPAIYKALHVQLTLF